MSKIKILELKKEASMLQERKNRLDLLMKEIKPCQKVIFDVETTGLDPSNDEILQFSAINENGDVLLNTYVKPQKHKSWNAAMEINHITPQMVEKCKTIEQLWEKIQGIFLSANELIAYNGNFDIEFLEHANIYFSPDIALSDVMLEFAPIYGEYNEYYGEYKWQKLSTCANYYNYHYEAHDSLEDVKATLYCYNKIRETESFGS